MIWEPLATSPDSSRSKPEMTQKPEMPVPPAASGRDEHPAGASEVEDRGAESRADRPPDRSRS